MEGNCVSNNLIGSGKWIRLIEIKGHENLQTEMIERTTKSSSGIDGVDIIALLETTPTPQIVLISQFRPPLNAYCLEFPAGLITEEAESPTTAAMRELQEETGYYGYEAEVFESLMFIDPNSSNCNMKYVKIKIDPTDPKNINPIPSFQDEEIIKTHLFPFDSNLYDSLLKVCKENKLVMDSRLASIAMGMKFILKIK